MQRSSGHVPKHLTTTKPAVSYCAISLSMLSVQASYHLSRQTHQAALDLDTTNGSQLHAGCKML